ncbi:MAG: DUF192 domain-containing protein [Candidatus Falkowbacteria bacterium]|nr:DUF192 domain-containing protein [Candidatus Falkowbacteria bacterium]
MFLRVFIIVTVIFSVLSLFFVKTNNSFDSRNSVAATINQVPLRLELATNEQQWFDGLSRRSSLCDNCGMLFVFPESKLQTFVMREMNFPLDMVWLNDKKIIGYNENLRPETTEPYTLYKSPAEVNYVLEINAGFVKKHNIKIDDQLIYEKN